MIQLRAVFKNMKCLGKYSIITAVGLLLIIWGIETPAGVLGKSDAVGYAVCHRIDLRSFHIGIRQFPLCARCTGQYVGAMIGLLFQAFVSRRRAGFPPRRVLGFFGLLGLAYAIDGMNSYLYLPPFLKAFPALPHLYEPSNTLRLFTGTGMGLAISAVLYPAFVGSIFEQPDLRPAMGGIKYFFILLGLGLMVDVLVLNGSSYVLYSVALVSASGVIILLSMAYTIVVLRLSKKENQFTRMSQINVPLLLGFLIAMSQIAVFDLIRFIITGTWSGYWFG